jgi:predicted Zn finger-like uncharacterized protein
VKFLCDQCKAKYQIADEKVAGKTVRMKCRKCGYLIEVRAAVTETSVSSRPPPPGMELPSAPGPGAGIPRAPLAPMASRAPQKPAAPPRAAPLATSLAAQKPAAKPPTKPEKLPSALAGAFKTNVQREEEVSAPFDMAELSPADEWYVAINGVPVGPIRVAEVRRKAALGAVTEDSLAWQEGLDEWRPVRSFPELAASIREAIASGRASLTPAPPEGRISVPGGQPRPAATRPERPAAPPPRGAPLRPAAMGPQPSAMNNVVPINSRLATAEKFEEVPDDRTVPYFGPPITADSKPLSVVPDPFASPAFGTPAPAPAAMAPPDQAAPLVAQPIAFGAHGTDPFRMPAAAAVPSIDVPAQPRKQVPWMAIAMVTAAAAFGIAAAVLVFQRPPAPPPNVVVQVPGAPPTVATPATTGGGPTTSATGETPDPNASAGGPKTPKGPIAMAGGGGSDKPGATSTGAKGPLDLSGLTGQNVAPTPDMGGDTPKAPGQCLSEGQVSSVINAHRVAVNRTCWERNPTQKPAVNVGVTLTIGADGSAQGVSASGDEPSVAKCIENDVRNWRFPAMGCSQKTSFSFKLVRQ